VDVKTIKKDKKVNNNKSRIGLLLGMKERSCLSMYVCNYISVFGIKSKVSCMVGEHSNTELHPSPQGHD
jgi:hypothetical protein